MFMDYNIIGNFLKKLILAKTRYKIHYSKLLIIIKTFKPWRHLLYSYKYKIFILTNYNNLHWFINKKYLTFY